MLELAVVLVLVALNGLFALSELAVVSARRPRLRAMAEAGRRGAGAARALAEYPGRFLSTVQIGITLVGVLAGAFSGSALGGRLAAWLVGLGLPPGVAEPLGLGAVVALVTYLSIVVGELVPKRLTLRNAEGVACAVAPLMSALTRVAAPAAWLLDRSADLVFRLLGRAEEAEQRVTEGDVRAVIAEAERTGGIEVAERRMITGVQVVETDGKGDRIGYGSPLRATGQRDLLSWRRGAAGVGGDRQGRMETLHHGQTFGCGPPMEEGTRMPKFMIKAIYTAEGIKGLKKDTASGREKAIAAACEAMGGKLDALYYALGNDNVFAIVDLPSHVHAASLGSAAAASGWVETRTVSLLTVAEMDKALGEEVKYRPPGG